MSSAYDVYLDCVDALASFINDIPWWGSPGLLKPFLQPRGGPQGGPQRGHIVALGGATAIPQGSQDVEVREDIPPLPSADQLSIPVSRLLSCPFKLVANLENHGVRKIGSFQMRKVSEVGNACMLIL